ncbi:VOC family protein [Bailinhaonella thermotolerans]|uniref:VOC family protein n=1 Tax=Bailinhaonella thermotolerans TaxID=1070861 RepID=A0A3A4AW35_9ACTN|nr:VOC family protein [Bailinhaonella thermotolerans]RJL34440.1 VOC family protein [Bailinhaonella thermotolerans]
MPVTLNHTIVPAYDNDEAAGFFAGIMGLERLPPAGARRHFAPVRVNETLTLDFMTVEDPHGLHLAFDVDPATFDAVLARPRRAAVPYGNSPADRANARVDSPWGGRVAYFEDRAGDLYEVISPR